MLDIVKYGALTVALVGCVASVDGQLTDDGEENADQVTSLAAERLAVDPNVGSIAIKADRSVLVTARQPITWIGDRLPLGILLKRVGRAAITEWAPAEGSASKFKLGEIGEWVRNPFDSAEEEFREHEGLPFAQRLGIVHGGNPYQRIQNLWPDLGSADPQGGPFRLLAVVNRMDLAGDVDERGIIDAAKDPRNFGEARLIFGLVDKDYENTTGKPYPMTFIIEYRLPALDANYNVVDNYDFAGKLFSTQDWRTQMQRWGNAFRQLSAWDPSTDQYRDHLAKLVARFARPDNFVALRANLEIRTNGNVEYDLREWYMLKDSWTLIPRKPRDEPYACGENPDLAKLVDYYWDSTKLDLDMARVTPANPRRVIGYHIPRTMRDMPVSAGDVLAGCPVDGQGKGILFEMPGREAGEEHRVTAPFGRAKENFVWRMPNTTENRRHQFAIRTCTGCHSKEAGVFGFHVLPRLANQKAELSTFLTGGATFTHGGKTYNYNELAKRSTYLDRASKADPTLALFEGLYRAD